MIINNEKGYVIVLNRIIEFLIRYVIKPIFISKTILTKYQFLILFAQMERVSFGGHLPHETIIHNIMSSLGI